jgi:hypothetical protein
MKLSMLTNGIAMIIAACLLEGFTGAIFGLIGISQLTAFGFCVLFDFCYPETD